MSFIQKIRAHARLFVFGRIREFMGVDTSKEARTWVLQQIQKDLTDPMGSFFSHSIIVGSHTPSRQHKLLETYYMDMPGESVGEDNGLPIPPPGLRMYYMDNDTSHYLESGGMVAHLLKKTLHDHDATLKPGNKMLDWGCASGRVLRHFKSEVESGVVAWGIDQDEEHINWARNCLGSQFKFATCTYHPHIPFEDNSFDFIYGISIFTHIEYLMDTWLLELRRITKPGGILIVTVHGENTIAKCREVQHTQWIPASINENEIKQHDITVASGPSWNFKHIFFNMDWLQQNWGHYWEILEIKPLYLDAFHNTVVMRKPLK